MRTSPITAYTDYPFVELGDPPLIATPMRHVVILSYDGDRYATIVVEGVVLSVKRGYLYIDPSASRVIVPETAMPRQRFEIPCWKGPK